MAAGGVSVMIGSLLSCAEAAAGEKGAIACAVERRFTTLGPPHLRLHLTRLSRSVAESAGPAAEVSRGGPPPQPPRR